MRIVVARESLRWLGGSETYAVTVAEHLQRLGHDVVLGTCELGVGADLAAERGVRVLSLNELATEPAVVLTQDAPVAYALADLRPMWPQVQVVHSDTFDLHLPVAIPQLRAVVTLYERLAKRIAAMDLEVPSARLGQPIDVERFRPTAPLRRQSPVLLALGNYLHGERLDLVQGACDDAGVRFERVGVHAGGWTTAPQVAINEADIVIGKARVVYEAMACGRAAYVYDYNGGEGWVTAANAPRLGADNFGGQAEPIVIDRPRLARDLAAYDPDSGLSNRDYVVANHAATAHAAALVEVLRAAAGGAVPAIRSTGAAELGRLTRLYQAAELERHTLRNQVGDHRREIERLGAVIAERDVALDSTARLAAELSDRLELVDAHFADAREWAARLDDELVATRGELDGVRRSRRWRLIQLLLRPLDRLRGRIGR